MCVCEVPGEWHQLLNKLWPSEDERGYFVRAPPLAEVGSPARAGVWPLRSLSQGGSALEVGLGTAAPAVSQIRAGHSEARGPGAAEKGGAEEPRFSP